MNQIGVAVLLLCFCTSTLAFDFQDCGSEAGTFDEISISCDRSEERCFLVRETDITGSVKFTPSKDSSTLTLHVFGILLDVAVPLPVPKPDVCSDPDSGIKCPLKKDQQYEYSTSFFLEKKVPSLSVDVIWEFRNENDEKIICVTFPAKVK